MKSHEFAKMLLALPDRTIAVPKVETYSDDEEQDLMEPAIVEETFTLPDGTEEKGWMIDQIT